MSHAGKARLVRILFTFAGGNGHFHPLNPIARAAEAAGHTVAMTGRPSLVPAIEAAGFTAFPTGKDTGPPQRIPLRTYSAEREDRDFREGFADRLTRERAPDILALCDEWHPDLLICDETDFGCMIAAERRGLPYASVLVIAAGSFVRHELIAEPLQKVRSDHELPPDPDLIMLSRYLVLSPFPPSIRDPAFPLPPTAHSIRPLVPEPPAGDAAPPWLADLDDAPAVYFTLGTAFNLESGDLFARVLAGLRDLPIQLVVTVGREIDPEEFGPQPGHVHIERYIPQAVLLPHCDVVVSHGGSGSVMGALTHGLPSVLIPLGADQPMNAARCEALGVARVQDAVGLTPESVREAVAALLADATYREHAEHVRKEIAALPGPAHAVELLEQLVVEKRPLIPG
jgi:UDP:flavonoid glycosyltransferase YjiC (YdhE family)